MEVTSFVLGMLAIVVVAFAVTTVVGLLKILKINKQIIYTIMNQIEATRRETDQAVDELHRSVGHESSEGRRYTDSRIDKLIDTYFDMKKFNEKKEILKG